MVPRAWQGLSRGLKACLDAWKRKSGAQGFGPTHFIAEHIIGLLNDESFLKHNFVGFSSIKYSVGTRLFLSRQDYSEMLKFSKCQP